MSYKYFKTFEELLEFICDYYNETDTKKADIDSLQKANQIIEMIFDDFDKDCFLQIW